MSASQHTGSEPTHNTTDKITQKSTADDLAARDANLREQRTNASAHAIKGQHTANKTADHAEIKPDR
jgi:hypothetical protein